MSFQYRPAVAVPDLTKPIKAPLELTRSGFYRKSAKRALDVVLVLAVSVPVALTVALLALLQFASDRRNPFYAQDRVGLKGDVFRMWKLRTMVCNADQLLEGYLATNPAARAEWQTHQKLRNDPRITPLGRMLRKTSLDELPQLWNVLVGDMSLVGPRPMMTSQRWLYPGTEYYEMRPGITGFWQISERNEASFHQRADYDGRYYRALSFGTDLGVLMRTVGVVLKATGR